MASKKKHPHPIVGEAWSQLSTPWVQQATDQSEKTGALFETARDHVILDYLINSGDVRPLAGLFQAGQSPGSEVLQYVAAMMGFPPESDLEITTPYIMKVRGQGGRKVKSGEIPWRDELLSKMMEQKIAADKKYAYAPDAFGYCDFTIGDFPKRIISYLPRPRKSQATGSGSAISSLKSAGRICFVLD